MTWFSSECSTSSAPARCRRASPCSRYGCPGCRPCPGGPGCLHLCALRRLRRARPHHLAPPLRGFACGGAPRGRRGGVRPSRLGASPPLPQGQEGGPGARACRRRACLGPASVPRGGGRLLPPAALPATRILGAKLVIEVLGTAVFLQSAPAHKPPACAQAGCDLTHPFSPSESRALPAC